MGTISRFISMHLQRKSSDACVLILINRPASELVFITFINIPLTRLSALCCDLQVRTCDLNIASWFFCSLINYSCCYKLVIKDRYINRCAIKKPIHGSDLLKGSYTMGGFTVNPPPPPSYFV